jgi:hypothetical protein
MTTMTPTATDLTLTPTRVQDISAASNIGIKALAKRLGCTVGELKSALEQGTNGNLAIALVEFEDTLPKAHVLGANGQPVPADGAASAPAGEEAPPTTRDRKPAKRSPRTAAATPATPAEGTPAPTPAPQPAEVIPPAEGTRAFIAQQVREGGTFNERAEGLVKGTDWVEAYVPLPIDLHTRCQAAAKAMGVSLKQFRTYAFLRLVAEVENAEG